MASVTITKLVSDLSNVELDENEGETVEFAYRGVGYTIDLTHEEAAEFDEAMATYIDNATRTSGGRRRSSGGSGGGSSAKSGDYNAKDVRVWAKSRQIAVPERGRIPADVLNRYLAEHG